MQKDIMILAANVHIRHLEKKTMKKIKKLSIALLFGIILLFSGCIKMNRGVEFKANGMIYFTMDARVSEKLISLSGQNSDEVLQGLTQGVNGVMKVNSFKEKIDGETWYGISGNGTVPKMMAQDVIAAMMGEDVTTTVTQSGFWVKTIQIDISKNPTNNNQTDDYSEYFAEFGRMGIEDEFVIKVPYEIISTNGMIDGNDDTRVSWDLYDFDLGNTTTKSLTLTYINWTPIVIGLIVIGIILFVIVPVIIIVNVIRVKKKRRRETEKAQYTQPIYQNNPYNNAYVNPQMGYYPERVPAQNTANYSGYQPQNGYYPDTYASQSQQVMQYDYQQENVNQLVGDNGIQNTEVIPELQPAAEPETVVQKQIVEEIPLVESNPVEDVLKMYGPGGSIYKK